MSFKTLLLFDQITFYLEQKMPAKLSFSVATAMFLPLFSHLISFKTNFRTYSVQSRDILFMEA